MAQIEFRTDNLDLALTKVAAGCEVLYTGRFEGVYRFESVKLRALMSRDKTVGEDGFEAALSALVARSRSGEQRALFSREA